jgi:transcriptional regulator with XRE-family HTH domain
MTAWIAPKRPPVRARQSWSRFAAPRPADSESMQFGAVTTRRWDRQPRAPRVRRKVDGRDRSHKSIPDGDPLGRALHGELVDERSVLRGISSENVEGVDVCARLCPFTNSQGDRHDRVLALYRRPSHSTSPPLMSRPDPQAAQEIGQRVRRFREERGLTLSALAATAELSKGYVSAIENGETPRPSGQTLYAIAQALGVTMSDLLGRRLLSEMKPARPPSLEEFAAEHHPARGRRADARFNSLPWPAKHQGALGAHLFRGSPDGVDGSGRSHSRDITRRLPCTSRRNVAVRKRPTNPAAGLFTRQTTAKCGKTRTLPPQSRSTKIPANRRDPVASPHD